MRINAVNNNQNQQNFGFKIKSVHLKSADGTKVLPVVDKNGEKLLFAYGSTDLFVTEALTNARKMVTDALYDLQGKIVDNFFFRGTPKQLRVEDVFNRSMQFAVKKDGDDYTLVSYTKHILDSEDKQTLKIEDWGTDPEESELLTTTKIVEIEPENQQELAELQQMHTKMADSIAPFRARYEYVFDMEFDESWRIDDRVL